MGGSLIPTEFGSYRLVSEHTALVSACYTILRGQKPEQKAYSQLSTSPAKRLVNPLLPGLGRGFLN